MVYKTTLRRHLRRQRTTRSTSRFKRGSKKRLCRLLTTRAQSSSLHKAPPCPITNRLPSSCSISRRSKPSPHIAPLQSRTNSHRRARLPLSYRQSIRSCNTRRLAIPALGTSTLLPRVPLRRRPWPSWRISDGKKKSTNCTRSLTSHTRKAPT